jgi:hypothetical protein
MKRGLHIALIGAARACAVGVMLIACHASSVSAEESTRKGCVAVAKQEYDAAKKQRLLQSRFGAYVRTGRLGRRTYLYCHS